MRAWRDASKDDVRYPWAGGRGDWCPWGGRWDARASVRAVCTPNCRTISPVYFYFIFLRRLHRFKPVVYVVLFFLTRDAGFDKKLLSTRGRACRPRVAGVGIAGHWSCYPVAVVSLVLCPSQNCLCSFCQAIQALYIFFILSSYHVFFSYRTLPFALFMQSISSFPFLILLVSRDF